MMRAGAWATRTSISQCDVEWKTCNGKTARIIESTDFVQQKRALRQSYHGSASPLVCQKPPEFSMFNSTTRCSRPVTDSSVVIVPAGAMSVRTYPGCRAATAMFRERKSFDMAWVVRATTPSYDEHLFQHQCTEHPATHLGCHVQGRFAHTITVVATRCICQDKPHRSVLCGAPTQTELTNQPIAAVTHHQWSPCEKRC